MKTIIILLLLSIVAFLALAIIVWLREFAGKLWVAARSVWRRIVPLLLGLAAGSVALVAAIIVDASWLAKELQIALSLAFALAVAIAIYIRSGAWFAYQRSGKYYPHRDHSAVKSVLADISHAVQVPVLAPFHRLAYKRRFWQRSEDRGQARFHHVIVYLRGAVPDDRASLDFSEAAMARLWHLSDGSLDHSVNELVGMLLLWLRECEDSLEQSQEHGPALHLRQCKTLVQSLEQIAVKVRISLSQKHDLEAELLRSRAQNIPNL